MRNRDDLDVYETFACPLSYGITPSVAPFTGPLGAVWPALNDVGSRAGRAR